MKMNHIPKINLCIWWSDNCTMLKLKSHKKVLKRLDIQNQDIRLNKSWVKNDQINFKNYYVGFYPIFSKITLVGNFSQLIIALCLLGQ